MDRTLNPARASGSADCLATELEPDSELERVFDGDEGGGDDAHGEYIDGVVADALGDGEMGVSSGAHGGAGF